MAGFGEKKFGARAFAIGRLLMDLARLIKRQEVIFIVIGAINTLVTYLFFVVLVSLGIYYLVANAIMYIFGIFLGFALNKAFTFKSKKKALPELVRYVGVYAVCFLIGNAILFLLVSKLAIPAYVAGAINAFALAIISWFGHKHFTFKNT